MSVPAGVDVDYFLNPPPGMPGRNDSKPTGLSYRLSDAQGAYNGLDARQTEKLRAARLQVYEVLDEVEQNLAKTQGPFLFGDRLSIADLSMTSWMERIDVLPEHFKAERLLNPRRFPLCRSWLAALRALPSYQN